MKLCGKTIDEFQQTILAFYKTNGRSFPWRGIDDPYAVLVSEFMLQQTQTERVIPKWTQWMERFPTVRSLAEAPLADVLTAWNGLGYNRRARYLHEAAKMLTTDVNNSQTNDRSDVYDRLTFPATLSELQKLPGIGPYTAGAVLVFAFNKPEIVIETNIRSVFIFFFFNSKDETDDRSLAVHDKDILPLIEQTLDKDNPRVWYYALMDYGAELKKKTRNPSRQSAHYTKQSKFHGSHRQARGAVIRSLTSHGRCSLEEIAAAENIGYDRLCAAADSLVAESFIKSIDGVYYIE